MYALDELIIRALAELRSPLLNRIMVDVTSMGSATVVSILTAIAAVLLIYISHNPRGAIQVAVATAGAELSVELIKRMLGRARPEIIERLVEVTGFSYPSGHAAASTGLYLTLAVIVGRSLGKGGRIAVHIAFGSVILLVATSRVYLGVHYPSDVLSGILVGAIFSTVTLKLLDHRNPKP
jgi:undecaprenyl-diphosphatase